MVDVTLELYNAHAKALSAEHVLRRLTNNPMTAEQREQIVSALTCARVARDAIEVLLPRSTARPSLLEVHAANLDGFPPLTVNADRRQYPRGGVRPINVCSEVAAQDISDLLSSALEGGSNYWCRIEGRDVPREVLTDNPDVTTSEVPMLGGKVFLTAWDDGTSYEHEGQRGFVLDRAACERGAAIMAKDHARHWGDFRAETGDAITGDVFLQCCVFGTVVFG